MVNSRMIGKVLLLSLLVWVPAYSKTVDETIRDAAKAGRSTLKDDEVLIDMDMRYKREDWERLQSNISSHKGIRGEQYRWTNKHVPYYIDPIFTSSQKQKILAGIQEWRDYTCLTFGEYNGEYNYVHVQDDNSGCNSYVGMMSWNGQPMNLARYGCIYHHTIVHEFGHAIGFQHEHQRPERDEFVQILWNNVGDGWDSAFTKMNPNNIDNRGVTYDYLSVMHYGQTAFSHNNRDRTIMTYDSFYQNLIGNSPGLAFSDIKLANLLYSCDDGCGNVDCPAEGFVAKDCKCYCDNNSWTNRLCECGTEGCGDGDGGGGDIECVDNDTQCEYWASIGECVANPNYMLANCAKSCRICGDNEWCRDLNTDCDAWSTSGYCTDYRYEDFMRRHCRMACGFCSA